MKKAEITAFLSIVTVLLVSFVLGILEISVIQTAGHMIRIITDRAVFSVFGEYHSGLLRDYGIFGLDGSYGQGEYKEENLLRKLHYFGSTDISHRISGIQYFTDDKGQSFREQVLTGMEEGYGISLIRDFTGMTARWEEESIRGEEMKTKERDSMEDLKDIRTSAQDAAAASGRNDPAETDPAEIDPAEPREQNETQEENPFLCLEQLESKGVLSLVLPDHMNLSGLSVDPDSQASNRSLRTGYGTFPKRQGMDGIAEKLLFNEYILDHFLNASGNESGGNGTPEEKKEDVSVQENPERTLQYEVEYILEGKGSDKENLEAVLLKLFFIRMALNYVYLMGDTAKQAQVTSLAAAVTTLLLIPEAAEILKQLILLAWAAGESTVDLKTLLAGNRVPVVKSRENWNLPLSSLLSFGQGENWKEQPDTEGGISYEDYLRMFLFLKNTDQITMRTIDRVEENLSAASGDRPFRADWCITRISLENEARILGDITYTFPAEFGYQ